MQDESRQSLTRVDVCVLSAVPLVITDQTDSS